MVRQMKRLITVVYKEMRPGTSNNNTNAWKDYSDERVLRHIFEGSNVIYVIRWYSHTTADENLELLELVCHNFTTVYCGKVQQKANNEPEVIIHMTRRNEGYKVLH